MRVYVPSVDRIKQNWEKAKNDPDKAYHFTTDLEILIRFINKYPDLANDEIPGAVDPITHIHPFAAAVEALRQWHIGDGDYEHAKAAKHLLAESVHRSLSKNHRSIFEKSLVELVELQAPLRHDNTWELTLAVDYLFDNHYDDETDENGSRFHRLVDLVLDHADPDDPQHHQLLHRLFIICIIRGNRYANADTENLSTLVSNINSGLKAFEKVVAIAEQLDIDKTGVKRRYANEYRRYFKHQGRRDDIVKGEIIKDGLQKQLITETLEEDEKVEWQQEMQNAFARGSQQLKHSGKSMPLVPSELIERQADSLTDFFKWIAVHHDTTTALYWLINEPELLPPFEKDEQRTISFVDRINRVHPQPSGHVTSLNPDANITRGYANDMLQTQVLTAGTIYELIEAGWITERNFFELLDMIPGVTDHNIWYLTDAVNHLFDKEHTAAIHISIPRLETTLYEVLNHLGSNVVRQMDRGTGTRTLTSLLDELKAYVTDDFYEYIQLAYAKKEGEAARGNLRNRLSHGHLRIGQDNHLNAILPIVDILRITYRAAPTPFIARFGYPSRFAQLADSLQSSSP